MLWAAAGVPTDLLHTSEFAFIDIFTILPIDCIPKIVNKNLIVNEAQLFFVLIEELENWCSDDKLASLLTIMSVLSMPTPIAQNYAQEETSR